MLNAPLRSAFGRTLAAALLFAFAAAGPADALLTGGCPHHFGTPAASATPAPDQSAAHHHHATAGDDAPAHGARYDSDCLHQLGAAHAADDDGAAAGHEHRHDDTSPCDCLGECAPSAATPIAAVPAGVQAWTAVAAAAQHTHYAVHLSSRQPYLIPFANGPPSLG